MYYKYNELQLAWLAALRSGKYKQGDGQLAIADSSKHVKYCCLGVACVIARKIGLMDLPKTKRTYSDDIFFGGEDNLLPECMVNPLRLRSVGGKLKKAFQVKGERIADLTDMNDTLKWTFTQIADYIETNPENVFVS